MVHTLLQRHVHACHTDDGVVFLDLRRNKYFGIGGEEMGAVTQLLCGDPSTYSVEPSPEQAAVLTAVTAELTKRGLLTHDASVGRRHVPVTLLSPECGTLDLGDEDLAHWPIRDGMILALSLATVAVLLKFSSLEYIVNRVRTRKEHRDQSQRVLDPSATHSLVSRYFRLRALLFTSKQKCFLDSLVLTEFLAHYKVFPQLVIAVATGPFKAHCWVQEGTTVLNGASEEAEQYVPILVI
jgi:transglutaminase superfamily protein